jgi:hypothetical protein
VFKGYVRTENLREAERLARAKGCTQIGLEVASTDNPEAKQLYEHLGYIDWGQGEFLISWEYIDTHSNQVTALTKSGCHRGMLSGRTAHVVGLIGQIMLLLVLSHVLQFAALRPSSLQICPFRIVPVRRYV